MCLKALGKVETNIVDLGMGVQNLRQGPHLGGDIQEGDRLVSLLTLNPGLPLTLQGEGEEWSVRCQDPHRQSTCFHSQRHRWKGPVS